MALSYSSNRTPRNIPSSLKNKLLFGNFIFIFGLVFFTFGAVFTIIFSSNIDFKSITFSPDQKTQGTILGKEATNSWVNKRRVQKYIYKFSVGTTDFTGYSYTSDNIDPYNSVEIEYEHNTPKNSRIVGMDLAPFSTWVILPLLIFPTLGLGFMVFAIIQGRKNLYLVTNGMLTKGRVIGKENTNITINKKPLYRILFEFHDQSGKLVQSKCTTTEPEKVMDEAEEFLVYESQTPQKAVLLDTLNKSVKLFLINQYN